ncbi:MAG: hypothetical protein JWO19_2360 [Bryobacterales bacterium]|jgi:hypothetical protein|nr:hypothetical protein [Bryobacterales bacterium]
MIRTSFGLALVSFLLMSGNAFADQFSFLSPGNVTWNGVYVNPYLANDNTQPQNNPLTIYCDDWNTDFSGNPTWNANVYTLTAGNASHFKYGNTTPNYNVTLLANNQLSATLSSTPTPFNRYLEAAWLDDQWRNAVANHTGTDDMQRKLAAAMWTLFVDSAHVGSPLSDPTSGLIGAINSSGFGPSVYQYLQNAQTAVAGGYNAAGWDVIVPVGQNSNGESMQEFLVYGFSGNTVPEPSAVILLGTIIGYLALKLRNNGKRQAS